VIRKSVLTIIELELELLRGRTEKGEEKKGSERKGPLEEISSYVPAIFIGISSIDGRLKS